MKRILVLAAALAAIISLTAMKKTRTPKTDDEGHRLIQLWAKYNKAENDDKPRTQLSILEEIRTEAARKGYSYDFYDAANRYVQVGYSLNWKDREPLLKALEDQVKQLDDPIVIYSWMRDQGYYTDKRWEFVKSRLSEFEGVNRAFYENISPMDGFPIASFIRIDKEYVLWDMLQGRYFLSRNPDGDEIYTELKNLLEGQYPDREFLKYYITTRLSIEEEKAGMKALAEELKGNAVGLYPRQWLLYNEFYQMEKDKATEAQYREFHARCKAFEKDRKALKGNEALIASGCTKVEDLIERMEDKDISVSVVRDSATVTLQNLSSVTVTIRQVDSEKVLHRWTVDNPTRSFYLKDDIKTRMPVLDDEDYEVEVSSGKLTATAHYTQHSLSVAIRHTSEGSAVYVTDHLTGEPLKEVTLILWKGDREVLRENVSLDGFTPLPASFVSQVNEKSDVYYSLSATCPGKGIIRRSNTVGVRDYFYFHRDRSVRQYCHIYKDRGAYNPGDEMSFKAILFEGNLVDKMGVLEDVPLTAVLKNSEGKEIGRQELRTNSFGSVSGSFTLPVDQRNGMFSLSILNQKGRSLCSDSFRVDEFVLPTFDLSFDKNETLYMPGDTVKVSGALTSYSGHILSDARLSVVVRRWSDVIYEDVVTPDGDGRFAFSFPAEYSGRYVAEVLVSDNTGETQEYYTGVYVNESISVDVSVKNGADGEYVRIDEENEPRPYYRRYPQVSRTLLDGDCLVADLKVRNSDGGLIPLDLDYTLTAIETEKEVMSGKASSGETVQLNLSGLPSGLYNFYVKSVTTDREGKEVKSESTTIILYLKKGDKVLDAAVRRVFISGPTEVPAGGEIGLRMGAADGPVWAIATLFGDNREILETRKIHLTGERGTEGSLLDLSFLYKDEYPDAVRLQVFYFKMAEAISFEREYSRIRTRLNLPLTFSRFTDKAYPGTQYTFKLSSAAGAEALAAVFDKSIDAIAPNSWHVVTLSEFSVPSVGINSAPGHVSGEDPSDVAYGSMERLETKAAFGATNTRRRAKSSYDLEDNMVVMADMAMVEERSDRVAYKADEAESEATPEVREKFENALAFLPHLTSDKDGNITFTVNTSDKLSTYHVRVYAHDPEMRNALVEQDMVVSVPVKVALVEPKYLYEGDKYNLAASVSSIEDKPIKGKLVLEVFDTKDYKNAKPVSVQKADITIPAKGSLSRPFPVTVPASVKEGAVLGFKLSFIAKEFSDALFVPVPVYQGKQTLTEAHSAVLLDGMDREALLKELRSRFVNVPASAAELRDITVLDMVRDAIPSHVNPDGKDVLSLSEAYYIRLVASQLPEGPALPEDTQALLGKILACRNGDGGFGWFEGMRSSQIITAVILERFAKLRERGFEIPDMTKTVQYLDNVHFSGTMPYWCGWISDAQYCYIRSCYASVPFTWKPKSKTEKKDFETFCKETPQYLTPSEKDGRGMNGQILNKARRLKTLKNLLENEGGVALAKEWGLSLGVSAKIRKSLDADVESLLEYAVEHRDGGWYYPNAVMPWRGLLESEAYAHSLLSDLLNDYSPKIADGIRLWLMLQKETQKWDAEPAFIDAIHSVLSGSEAVLNTRVLALSATYTAPFAKIKAAGNGFTIERKYFRIKTQEQLYDNKTAPRNDFHSTLVELKDGEKVKVGEKIVAQYQIWNQENRSFVKIDSPREASLRPVDQLSGHYGWRFSPLRIDGYYTISPQGYRNVKAERTEYFFDTYPEEKTTITEEFFVTQDGTFSAPVITIESLYAPHYRANDGFHRPLVSEVKR